MSLSRRNFLTSSLSLLAGVVLGRCQPVNPVAVASHPPEYDRAPVPDLAGEITTDPCLTRDQIERIQEMALERACPVELSWRGPMEERLEYQLALRQVNPPIFINEADEEHYRLAVELFPFHPETSAKEKAPVANSRP